MYSRKVLSIDIGTSNTKIVVGKQLNKSVFVEKAFMLPTPSNSYEDGQFIMVDKLRKSIGDILNTEKIKTKRAVCTLKSTSIITREIVLPSAKPKELKSLVQFEIQKHLPILLEEHLIEYKVIEEMVEEKNKKLKILVAVLPKKMASNYFMLLKDLKLQPVALDVHDNAISKLFDSKIRINDENSSSDKTVAIIDLGHSNINLSIIDKGVQRFSRIIPRGGKDINTNIANSFNLTVTDAEQKKIQNSDIENLENNLSSHSMTNELIRSNIDIWIEDIQRIFKYYTSRNTGNKIDEIYLYGGSSKIKGITGFIDTMLNIPTFKVEKINNIKLAKELEKMEIDYYLNAIAGIIRR